MKTPFLLILVVALGASISIPVFGQSRSNPQYVGTTPRLASTPTGQVLLSWVEKEAEKQASFYFAISADGGETFSAPLRVPAPRNLSVHAEGMPKIAIKANGTLLALFEVPRPTPESRFSGDLWYMTSADKGKSWTSFTLLARYTGPGKSHSFADMTRLPSGEIGIVWLDEKLPGQEGRSVKYTQTTAKNGFGPELLIDSNACQCCRTNIFVDNKGRILLTYRDLAPSEAGKPASRDISRATSTDGGETFGLPQLLYADNWQVAACPHTGPGVAQAGESVYTAWFSGQEANVGLRLAKTGHTGLVALYASNRAKHPQLVGKGDQIFWLWDESVRLPGQAESEPIPKFTQRIALRTHESSQVEYITPETVSCTYPVGLATAKGLLVAFEQKTSDGVTTIVTRLFSRTQPVVSGPSR